MADIFISYNRDDQVIARRFAEAFGREGLTVWWDQTLKPGEAFDEVTEKALNEAKAVVVLWSKSSVGSRWVRAEATQAHDNKNLLPVMIEACKRPIMFELTHTTDLSQWKGGSADPVWRAFLADVQQFLGKNPAQSVSGTAQPTTGGVPRPTSRILAIGAAIVFLLGGTWWAWTLRGVREPATAAASIAGPIRILVLPFANQSADHDQDYFADNLASEVSNLLGQIKGLRPLGDATSRFVRGKDPREIGTTLDVRYVVDGVVFREGNRVRIIPQLVDTRDGEQLWSQRYEREIKDTFALYEEIAGDVARHVGIVLDVGNMPRALGGTNNPEAYDKFLRSTTDSVPPASAQTPDDLWRWVANRQQLLRDAVRLDPQFANAWISLLTSLSNGAATASGIEAAALLREREEVAARLESLQFEGWQAPRIRAEVYMYQNRWPEAVANARAAANAAPSEDVGAKTLWPILLRVGWFNEAIPHMQGILQADPLDNRAAGLLVQALRLAGRDDEARSVAARFNALFSPMIFAGFSEEFRRLMDSGTSADAADLLMLKKLMVGPDGELVASLDISPRMLNDPVAFRAALHRVYDDPAMRNEQNLALVSKMARFFGDADLAFEAYRHIVVDFRRSSTGPWGYPEVRTDPRFKQVLRDLHLVEFWRQNGKWSDFCKPVGKDDFECH